MGHDVIEPFGPSAGGTPPLPRTAADAAVAASARGLVIPDACMPGVVANLALLDSHVATLLGSASPPGR